jgi:hypothetical protein
VQLKSFKDTLISFKTALTDLSTTTKNGTKKLGDAFTAFTKAANKQQGGGKPTSSLPMREFAKQIGTAIPEVGFALHTAINQLNVPLLITQVGAACPDVFAKDSVVSTETLQPFMEKFTGSKLREEKGRAERPIKAASKTAVQDLINKIVLPSAVIPPERAHADCSLHAFGIARKESMVSTEKGRCASIRMQFAGVRSIVAIDSCALCDFAIQQGLTAPTPDHLKDFMRAMTKEVMERFIAGPGAGKVYYGDVQAGQVLLLPFDWLFAEECHHDCDISGVRALTVFKADADKMQATAKWLVAVRKQNNILDNAIDYLSTLDD